jgi:hypothetical protein
VKLVVLAPKSELERILPKVSVLEEDVWPKAAVVLVQLPAPACPGLPRRDPAGRRHGVPGVAVRRHLAVETDGPGHPALQVVVRGLRPADAVDVLDALAQAVIDIGVSITVISYQISK